MAMTAVDPGALAWELRACRGIGAKFDCLLDALRPCGIDRVFYGYLSSAPDRPFSEEVVSHTNLPEAYARSYHQEGLADHDYLVRHVLASDTPVRWYEPELLARLTSEERHIDHVCMAHGMGDGILFPIREVGQGVVGGMSLIPVAMPRRDFSAILRKAEMALHLAATVFHLSVQAEIRPLPAEPLSHGERDCLLRAASGWTAEEVAEHLGISTSLIEKRQISARAKLRANTLAQAVAKAMVNGLIEP